MKNRILKIYVYIMCNFCVLKTYYIMFYNCIRSILANEWNNDEHYYFLSCTRFFRLLNWAKVTREQKTHVTYECTVSLIFFESNIYIFL